MNIKKIFTNESVNIVLTANNKYAKPMAVTISSLIEHANDNRNYDIIVFETDINENIKKTLENFWNHKNNISIRCFNLASIFENVDDSKMYCCAYYSKEVYLRLFIPDLLKDYDKVLYIDSDTIVQADVAELFDEDISNYYIAAVKDYNIVTNRVFCPDITQHFDNILPLKDENKNRYFNSGILLMNLNACRNIKLSEKALDLLGKIKTPKFPDQDLLNIVCEDHVKYMVNSWNFEFGINPALILENRFLSDAIEWTKGLADQKIIHYTSAQKPWDNPTMSYADIWWKCAKTSPVYQELLKEFFGAHPDVLIQHLGTLRINK